jgi:Tfp pilus assembly protein PilZ
MRQRGTVRIVPRTPITIAIQDGGVPNAYGVVANISEAGVCIWTDADLDPGVSLNLRLSFPRRSQPLDAEGVVVWGEPRGSSRNRRYGLKWKDQTSPRLERLKGIIAASA